MKKLLSSILALTMILTLATTSSAAESQITVEQASEQVALSFMQNSLNESVEIAETTPFYDLDNNVTAYHVSFSLNGTPSGYVLISLLNLDNPIVEFAFEGPGLVSTIAEKQAKSATNAVSSDNIYFLGAGGLFTGDPSTELQNVYDGGNYPAQKLNESYQETLARTPMPMNDVVIRDGILDWDNASIDTSSIEEIPYFGSGSDYWLLDDFSKGNNVCSPTCATNILWYWGVQRGYDWVVESGDKTGFDLADWLFTVMSLDMGTIPPLGTLNVWVIGAYREFLEDRGSNFSLITLTDNKYSDFTDAVDSGNPVHTMLRNESLFSLGHDVMTFGYGESTRGTEYLFVMDGWENYGRFVNFDYYPIIKGIEVSIGSTPD